MKVSIRCGGSSVIIAVLLAVAMAFVLAGCNESKIKRPVEQSASKKASQKPSDQTTSVSDWEKPYNENNEADLNEECGGVINQAALTEKQRELLDMDPLAMTDEQSAAYVNTICDVYHRWSHFNIASGNNEYPQNIPYSYLAVIGDNTTSNEIKANLLMCGVGLPELCYGPNMGTVDTDQLARLNVSVYLNKEGKSKYGQKMSDQLKATAGSSTRIIYERPEMTITNYSVDAATGKAEFHLHEVYSKTSQIKDYDIEAYTQKFTDAKTGEQKTIVLYNILSGSDLSN